MTGMQNKRFQLEKLRRVHIKSNAFFSASVILYTFLNHGYYMEALI
jgi:hypothetical protein